MYRFFMLVLFVCALGPMNFAHAQQTDAIVDVTDSIVVFDASGSMWGQIDGIAKIVIARDVVQGLLKDLPADRRLGLVAYGHRRKGDCSDIETLVPVGTDRAAISKAIAGITNPKGKTPMTAAVEHAAEELKYTENKATVILISDGEETCHADPCAAAAKLEELGIGLTVHTIGFGLEAQEADAGDQLRCIAEATGGQFFEAHDENELRDALSRVSAAEPEPVAAPAGVEVTLIATDQEGGPQIEQGLIWTVRHGATGEVIYTSEEIGTAHAEIPRGVHDVSVLRVADEATAEGQVDAGSTTWLTLPIIVDLQASVTAPATAVAGSNIRVAWEGPDEKQDYIMVSKADSTDNSYINFTYTARGNPLELLMPAEVGAYEVRYVSQKTKAVLARQAIDVTDVQSSIAAPATAVAGSIVTVSWTGPDYKDDYISVAKVGAPHNKYENYTYTSRGMPLQLLMPAEPGAYEIRYVQNQGYTVLAHEPIEVTDVQASIEAPATAAAGSTISVSWTGPDYKSDYISVAKVGASHRKYENYTYTSKGMPLQLLMPVEPGAYEIRYVQNQGYTVLAHEPIEVAAVQASVEAPATAVAGSTIKVNWTGPDYKHDYISVAKVGAPDNKYTNYTYTSKGTPLELKMPDKLGNYEIRYILDQKRTLLIRKPITINP